MTHPLRVPDQWLILACVLFGLGAIGGLFYVDIARVMVGVMVVLWVFTRPERERRA